MKVGPCLAEGGNLAKDHNIASLTSPDGVGVLLLSEGRRLRNLTANAYGPAPQNIPEAKMDREQILHNAKMWTEARASMLDLQLLRTKVLSGHTSDHDRLHSFSTQARRSYIKNMVRGLTLRIGKHFVPLI